MTIFDPTPTIPAPAFSSPTRSLPRGACDTHMHVFGPFDRFPLPGPANYAVPDADLETHTGMINRLGLDRAVLVQPSPYQTDHGALLDALVRDGGYRLRGVGSCDAGTPIEQLRKLAAAGVVGLRFVDIKTPAGAPYPGTQGLDIFEALRERMADCGLHAQLWAGAKASVAFAERVAGSGMALVLDHLAGLGPEDRRGTPRFDALAEVLASGCIWVKLTYFRKSAFAAEGTFDDMRGVVTDLVEARADRMLWASDWPFVKFDARVPDAGKLLDQLRGWVGSEAFAQILSTNPTVLFGFPA